MMKKKYQFNYGRSAFKYGLLSYNLNTKRKILIPDFICNEITNALDELSIPYIFYNLKDNLKPDWEELKKIKVSKCSAILMVHYFGNSQNIEKYINYAKENNLILIEDNAHGFSGKYKSKEMGTFGDFGISSPRKMMNNQYGGVLYKNTEVINLIPIKKNFAENIFALIFYLKNKPSLIKKSIKRNFLNQGSVPWCFPVYVSSDQERVDMLNWGWENKFSIFTWPSLPTEIIKDEGDGYKKWKKLICFSTDPSNVHIKKYI